MPILSVLLAVVAAAAFALGAVLQQGSARCAAQRHGHGRVPWLPVLGVLDQLLHDRRWLAGWVVNVLGFGCHVFALHLGTIAVVQATITLQLLFALVISAVRHSISPTARDWGGAVAVCTGIATLALLRGGVEQHLPPRSDLAIFVGAVAVLVTCVLAVARLLRGDAGTARYAQARTALVAATGGVCFCSMAAFVVVITADIAQAGPRAAIDWPLLGFLASAATAALLVQDSFAGGSLPSALTALTIADPVSSAIVGLLLFDAVRPAGSQLGGLTVAIALVVTGVVLLATSPTLHDEPR